jgi:hypothetical protein
MTFITKAFNQLSESDMELLAVRPPTEESRALAVRVGQIMGSYAYPGDMVLQSVQYEAGRLGWPGEITATIGNLAYEGMQRGY